MEIANNHNISQITECCNCYKAANLTVNILNFIEVSNFDERYILGKQLGWGRFGVIRECIDKLTGEVLACKSIAKDRLVTHEDMSSIKLEIEIMTRLSGHPNVVSLKAVYEEGNYVHLLMELCAGGELFHQLEKQGKFSEREAWVLFRHLMQVVKFCHESGVVHRDLKPENILLATTSSSSPIKLADFGLATYIRPDGQNLQGTVGSPFYIAPEVLVGGYNQAADVWSAGVILYILLSGMPPFSGNTKSKIFDAVRAANLKFPYDPWDKISASAKDLIRRMLCVDPSKRITAAQVLEHSWVKNSVETTQELNVQYNIVSMDLELCQGSLCSSPVICRNQDYSFSNGSPAATTVGQDNNSSAYTCNSSFSSLLVEDDLPCSMLQQFSFKICNKSGAAEILTTVSSMPSFSFASPGQVVDEGSISRNFGSSISTLEAYDIGVEKLLLFPASSPYLKCKEEENVKKENQKDGSHGSKTSGIQGKRNHTIGVGEVDKLHLIVGDSIIRWASCTHIPSSTSSVGLSLVC